MNLTISVFWVVIIIIAIHTIVQHFLNWLFRAVGKDDDKSLLLIPIMATLAEILLIMKWLDYILNR